MTLINGIMSKKGAGDKGKETGDEGKGTGGLLLINILSFFGIIKNKEIKFYGSVLKHLFDDLNMS